jgi:hypothetical protein
VERQAFALLIGHRRFHDFVVRFAWFETHTHAYDRHKTKWMSTVLAAYRSSCSINNTNALRRKQLKSVGRVG